MGFLYVLCLNSLTLVLLYSMVYLLKEANIGIVIVTKFQNLPVFISFCSIIQVTGFFFLTILITLKCIS